MQQLLDLHGASGSAYRFRLIDGDERLPVTAGNFAYVGWLGHTPQVFCCGAVNTLAAAADGWNDAVRVHGAAGLYVRLNVARATRDHEHDDIVAQYRPAMVKTDF